MCVHRFCDKLLIALEGLIFTLLQRTTTGMYSELHPQGSTFHRRPCAHRPFDSPAEHFGRSRMQVRRNGGRRTRGLAERDSASSQPWSKRLGPHFKFTAAPGTAATPLGLAPHPNRAVTALPQVLTGPEEEAQPPSVERLRAEAAAGCIPAHHSPQLVCGRRVLGSCSRRRVLCCCCSRRTPRALVLWQRSARRTARVASRSARHPSSSLSILRCSSCRASCGRCVRLALFLVRSVRKSQQRHSRLSRLFACEVSLHVRCEQKLVHVAAAERTGCQS